MKKQNYKDIKKKKMDEYKNQANIQKKKNNDKIKNKDRFARVVLYYYYKIVE